MGSVQQIVNMKSFALVCAFIASVSCEAYTIGQVAHGATYGGIITGVDYGHGHVSGYGAIGNRGIYGYAHPGAYYGKRDAEAEPEAKPYYYGGYGLGYAGYGGYGYSGLGYAHHGYYYGKREAEAEAKPYYYGGYGGYGYSRPYSYGTYGLGYGRGYYWG